uniref:Uncharacterized protein n=1 Tax=Arundo donax TaxID=35708 RepID=A0A0A9ECV2_ARUDO
MVHWLISLAVLDVWSRLGMLWRRCPWNQLQNCGDLFLLPAEAIGVSSWLSYQSNILQILKLMILESMFFCQISMSTKECGMMF